MKYTLFVRRKDHTFCLVLGAWLIPNEFVVIIKHGTFTAYEYQDIIHRPAVTVWFTFQNNVYDLFKRGNYRNERAGVVERKNLYICEGGAR